MSSKRQEQLTPHQLTARYWKNLTRKFQYQISIYGKPTDPAEMTKDRFARARQEGYASGLEVVISNQLQAAGINPKDVYETKTIRYTFPSETRRYTPDFPLKNGIVVETKGRWVTADRKKMKLIRQEFPEIDIRIVFSNSKSRISKTSKTTYGMFCEKLGIPYADKVIPEAWLDEPRNYRSLAALEAATGAN